MHPSQQNQTFLFFQRRSQRRQQFYQITECGKLFLKFFYLFFQNLCITLYAENKKDNNKPDLKKIGINEFELAEFMSDKVVKRDFFKYFSGKDIFPILSWGLSVKKKHIFFHLQFYLRFQSVFSKADLNCQKE
jgi:hypothetical protein